MTGIILAGGKNTRIGKTKALLKLGNEVIIENIIKKFELIFDDILIVGNNNFTYTSIRVVNDIFYDKGPLGGLHAALTYSKSKYNFVVACDMPFLNIELMKFMKNNCDGFDAIIPKLHTGYEVLHAIYSKTCIDTIEQQLQKNNLKLVDFINNLRIKEITEDIIKNFDSQLFSFFNINVNSDYEIALKLIAVHNCNQLM